MYRALEDDLWAIAEVEKASVLLGVVADNSNCPPSSKHADAHSCVGAYCLKLSKYMAGDDIAWNVCILVQADAQ